MNCFSDLKNFENSRSSASNFKTFSRSLEQFFLTVGQNNFGNKIPFPPINDDKKWSIENYFEIPPCAKSFFGISFFIERGIFPLNCKLSNKNDLEGF